MVDLKLERLENVAVCAKPDATAGGAAGRSNDEADEILSGERRGAVPTLYPAGHASRARDGWEELFWTRRRCRSAGLLPKMRSKIYYVGIIIIIQNSDAVKGLPGERRGYGMTKC